MLQAIKILSLLAMYEIVYAKTFHIYGYKSNKLKKKVNTYIAGYIYLYTV